MCISMVAPYVCEYGNAVIPYRMYGSMLILYVHTYTEWTTITLEAAIYCLVASGAPGSPYIHPGCNIQEGQVEGQGVSAEVGRPCSGNYTSHKTYLISLRYHVLYPLDILNLIAIQCICIMVIFSLLHL